MDNGFSCINSCTPDPPSAGPLLGSGPTCRGSQGDPVDFGSRIFTYNHTDLELTDVTPIQLTRTYRENDASSYAFGVGMIDNYDLKVIVDPGGQYTYADLVLPDAGRIHYTRMSFGHRICGCSLSECLSPPASYSGSTIGLEWK
jgi:hypothetical protein